MAAKKKTTAAKTKRRQAVVVIHGIGEQKPMDTLWGFVKSMWLRNHAIHKANHPEKVWSKPHRGLLNSELRRITTGYNIGEIRTDFFEFYYQHLIKDTKLSHVFSWARTLLFRMPASVPQQLRSTYYLLWVLIAAAGLAFLNGWIGSGSKFFNSESVIGMLLLGIAGWVLKKIVGDAARYLMPAPENLEIRDQVRKAGAKLLLDLSDPDKGPDYSRIIVVGHSLGSVVAYDIVQQAWIASYSNCGDTGKRSKLYKARAALEELIRTDKVTWDQAQPLQRDYFDALAAKAGADWRIDHLITCGSPLAHADILLAHDRDEFDEKVELRELSTCLPTTEGGGQQRGFTYSSANIPHFAAAFAATQWTNLYFPCEHMIKGDLIGGPISHLFGSGIHDLPVTSKDQGGYLLHTRYWKAENNQALHLKAFREVLDLADTRRP